MFLDQILTKNAVEEARKNSLLAVLVQTFLAPALCRVCLVSDFFLTVLKFEFIRYNIVSLNCVCRSNNENVRKASIVLFDCIQHIKL